MAKKVLNVFKKLGRVYSKGFYQMYGPCIEAGVCPFI